MHFHIKHLVTFTWFLASYCSFFVTLYSLFLYFLNLCLYSRLLAKICTLNTITCIIFTCKSSRHQPEFFPFILLVSLGAFVKKAFICNLCHPFFLPFIFFFSSFFLVLADCLYFFIILPFYFFILLADILFEQ
jgi:hypothetical protein